MDSLKEYFVKLETNLGPKVLGAVKNTIDTEAKKTAEEIRLRTPVSGKSHTHLIDTLVLKPVEKFGYYGWKLEHEGYNEYGVPYQMIANALNRGRADMPGLKHIDYAFSLLRGMDNRIIEAVDKAINEIK